MATNYAPPVILIGKTPCVLNNKNYYVRQLVSNPKAPKDIKRI